MYLLFPLIAFCCHGCNGVFEHWSVPLYRYCCWWYPSACWVWKAPIPHTALAYSELFSVSSRAALFMWRTGLGSWKAGHGERWNG